uniref:Uncharacterized protein n=1 Tax=Arundo donax TaxID=35708 RepID=A0A0A9DB65_ARUDO
MVPGVAAGGPRPRLHLETYHTDSPETKRLANNPHPTARNSPRV